MNLSLSKLDLMGYVEKQLNNFYPDKNIVNFKNYENVFDIALDRLNYCFQKVAYHRYNNDGESLFNHLYSDHYLMFIWFLANSLWKEKGDEKITNKLYYLNKTLHSFDCMYDTGLPDIFLVFHGGTGTLLGKGLYNDYFVALHGCTIGSHKGKYPQLGRGVALTAHSTIIGECKIGDNVSISNNTSIFQKDIPANTVAYTDRNTGKLNLKPSLVPYSQQFFNVNLAII